MLHFAYGEDLSHAEFKKVCAGADWFGAARLEDHRLIFNSQGRANVRAEVGAVVWGGLWLVPAASLAELDGVAVSDGYERTTRRIVSPAGPRTEATIYLSRDEGEGVAAAGLLERMLAGAKENRLPAPYVQELKLLLKAGGARAGKAEKTHKDSR